ncbi:MAG: hypothetical protein EOM69_13145, partial [Clostridia bacterium]|nr:hypothetical protein [Clostridia bacterium]
MQNLMKAKSRGGLTARAKRVLAVVAVFILTFSLSAAALADGGRGNGAPTGAPSGGQQTPGVTGGQQPENGNGEQNGSPARDAVGVNLDKIEDAIAAIEDETVQANLTALLDAYAEALEAKQAAIAANETDSISELAAAASAAKDALDAAMAEVGLSLDDILAEPEQAEDGTGRALGRPELDTESIATSIAALDDTDENKAALEGLLNAYQNALQTRTSANTASMTEDEIAALDAESAKVLQTRSVELAMRYKVR